MDTAMEMRSIMALLLPCPPIPIIALNESEGHTAQTSSHDAYGMSMDIAARRNDRASNARRARDQMDCSDRLKRELRAILGEPGAPIADYETTGLRIYEAMCAFTTSYLFSYYPLGTRISFAYPSLDLISDTMRARAREWLAGREMVQGKNANARAEDHAWKSIARIYCECATLVLEFEDHKEGDDEEEEEEEKEEEKKKKEDSAQSFLGLLVEPGQEEGDPSHM